jgi:hypothetical protein
MRTHRLSLLLGLAALALAGCASAPKPELSRIQGPNIDFQPYTFTLYPGRGEGLHVDACATPHAATSSAAAMFSTCWLPTSL